MDFEELCRSLHQEGGHAAFSLRINGENRVMVCHEESGLEYVVFGDNARAWSKIVEEKLVPNRTQVFGPSGFDDFKTREKR
jgi:hypothetical protein